MKTKHLKAIALAIATAIIASHPASAGTAVQIPSWTLPSAEYVKSIQVGPKGVTSVVYKLRAPSSAPAEVATQNRAPKAQIAIGSGYQKTEI